MRYVIIGNSYAGIGAIEAIREKDREGDITVLTDEYNFAYARPLISYYLSGHVKAGDMYYRHRDFYKKYNVRVFSGERVTGVDTKEQAIWLEDGVAFEYNRLLISTGGQPSMPAIKGLDAGNVFSFTKWDDARGIKRLIKTKRRAVVLGGGLIGLKAAEALNSLGVNVTIVIGGKGILSLVLDDISGEIVNRHLRGSGIRTLTGRSVKEALKDKRGNVYGVILDDGSGIDCDILIVAKGVRPNVEFMKNTSVRVNRGIVVDRHMRTNVENVYAAGDVAEAWDMLNNRNSVIAIIPLAYEQGQIAGYNMAGGQRLYAGGIGMNSMEVAGLPVMTIGISSRVNESHEISSFRKGKVYRKLVFEGDRLVGAILVGDINYGGVLTHIIRSMTNIKDIKKELVEKGLKTGDFVSPVRCWNASYAYVKEGQGNEKL